MDDYVSRTELSPVDRAVVRASSPVPAIQAVSANRTSDALAQDKRSALPQSDLTGSSQAAAPQASQQNAPKTLEETR